MQTKTLKKGHKGKKPTKGASKKHHRKMKSLDTSAKNDAEDDCEEEKGDEVHDGAGIGSDSKPSRDDK
jgi:calcium-dependent protein kinase